MNDTLPQHRRLTNLAIDTSVRGKAIFFHEILRFVHGLRGKRKNLVTRRDVASWFTVTPDAAVDLAVTEVAMLRLVDLRPSARTSRRGGRWVLELTGNGLAALREGPSSTLLRL